MKNSRIAQEAAWLTSLYRSAKGVPLSRKISLVRGKITAPFKKRMAGFKRRARRFPVGAAYRAFGPERGNRVFWSAQAQLKSKRDTRARLEWLARTHPDYVLDFVQCALDHNSDPLILLELCYSPLARDAMREKLSDHEDGIPNNPVVCERIRVSQIYAAAYVGAVMLLVGRDAALRTDAYARSLLPLPRQNYHRFLDSISLRADTLFEPNSLNSALPERHKRRLIIIERGQDVASYRHLLNGADDITVFDHSDIFGKTDLSEALEQSDAHSMRVEHIRTRITRFSADYHRLHLETRDTAKLLMGQIMQRLGENSDLIGSGLPQFELDLADQLFFETLRVRALEKLVAEGEFDHIVVACRSPKSSGAFFAQLAAHGFLRTDPRVEFTSVAPSVTDRLKTRGYAIAATTPRDLDIREVWQQPVDAIARDLREKASKSSDYGRPYDADDPRKRLMFVASQSFAYDSSTVKTMASLGEHYQIKTAFLGGNFRAFVRSAPAVENAAYMVNARTISSRLMPDLSDLANWFIHQLKDLALLIEHEDIRTVLLCTVKRVVNASLFPATVNRAVFNAWMDQLKEDDALPELLLVCPQRSAKLGTLVEVARDYGIPSIALEPHGLNGNYARYSKVMTDFYGVISNYFRATSKKDFGIPTERCHVIGSPRIIAPKDYDAAAAMSEAREALAESQELDFSKGTFGSFFCQPSDWPHVEKVWRNILQASQDLNISILLKPHPEEAPSRVAQYLEVAQDTGNGERVFLVEGKPTPVIEASDFVLTGYSAAAIDAAILQKPVYCVSADGKTYPVDQHDIVGATLSQSAEELRSHLEHFVENPEDVIASRKGFLEKEPQFLSGPEPLIQKLVADVIAMPRDKAMRVASERPSSVFLDGPFQVYSV